MSSSGSSTDEECRKSLSDLLVKKFPPSSYTEEEILKTPFFIFKRIDDQTTWAETLKDGSCPHIICEFKSTRIYKKIEQDCDFIDCSGSKCRVNGHYSHYIEDWRRYGELSGEIDADSAHGSYWCSSCSEFPEEHVRLFQSYSYKHDYLRVCDLNYKDIITFKIKE
jgi:hypothetical protein